MTTITIYTGDLDPETSFGMAKSSTTTTFRIAEGTYEALKVLARQRGISLNAYINNLVETHVNQPQSAAVLSDSMAQQAPAQPVTSSGVPFALLTSSIPQAPVQAHLWNVVGYLRITQSMKLEALDDGGCQLMGRAQGLSLEAFNGPGTAPLAWIDFIESFKMGVSCDAQLCLYHPEDPETPLFLYFECMWKAPIYYARVHKAWEGGQWARRRSIRLDVPEGIKG